MTAPMPGRIIRDEVIRTRMTVSVGPVDRRALGTFGWFIEVRCRGGRDRAARDRAKYGTCIICRRKLDDDEQIHLVFNVVRDGKTAGNRLCCTPCAEAHGTFNSEGGER